MQASLKRIPGVARLLLGLFAWLGGREEFGLITRRTAGWANFGSARVRRLSPPSLDRRRRSYVP